MMDCTNCKNPMMTAELENVEIDFCSECGGLWLDAGELESLLGDDSGRQLIASFTHARDCPEKNQKCPICRRRMEKILAGKNMLLDRCPVHGLWFDRCELPQLLETTTFDPQGKVVRLLKEMFAN